MQIQRQLTSRLPWIATFYPSIEEKFEELNSALNCPETNLIETVCLTREAVEEIAYSESTPTEIAINFIEVLQESDLYFNLGVPSYRIFYVLNERGLKLQAI